MDAARYTDAVDSRLAANAVNSSRGADEDIEILGPEDIDDDIDDPLAVLHRSVMKIDLGELKQPDYANKRNRTFLSRCNKQDLALFYGVKKMYIGGHTPRTIAELNRWVNERASVVVCYSQFRKFILGESPYGESKGQEIRRANAADAKPKRRASVSPSAGRSGRGKAATRSGD